MYSLPSAKVMRQKLISVLEDDTSVARLSEHHLEEIGQFINIYSEEGSGCYEHRFVFPENSSLSRKIIAYVENALREQGYETRVYSQYHYDYRIVIKWLK